MMLLLSKNPLLQWALSDLLASLDDPRAASINGARVMEAIKHMITPDEGDEGSKWKNMHAALNITRGYLEQVTIHSRSPRHGKAHTTPGIGDAIFHRCWTVMDRYFHFLQQGSVNLSIARFPLLDAKQS